MCKASPMGSMLGHLSIGEVGKGLDVVPKVECLEVILFLSSIYFSFPGLSAFLFMEML